MKQEKYIIDESNYTGCCPECGANWDLGEIPTYLMNRWIDHPSEFNLEVGREQAERDARKLYGWTPENKLKMSSLLTIEASDDETFDTSKYYQCTVCEVAWSAETGERTEKYILDDYMRMGHEEKMEYFRKKGKIL